MFVKNITDICLFGRHYSKYYNYSKHYLNNQCNYSHITITQDKRNSHKNSITLKLLLLFRNNCLISGFFFLSLTDFLTKDTNPYPFDFRVCGSRTTRQSLQKFNKNTINILLSDSF